MKTFVIAVSVLVCLIGAASAFSQSSNGRISGTVSDATGALIPSVTVTATNNATGVVSTSISNDTGTYNIPGLLPGTYTVTAELTGFQTQTFKDVPLGNAAQIRLNFSLQVGAVAQAVEVTVSAGQVLLESSSSVGQVLEKKAVTDLPLVSNNVLDLVQVMAGVYQTKDPIFGANNTKFAGVSAGNVNVQRDGISVAGQRWPTGLNAGTELQPDLVGEIKMILAPVDAEMGRGSGQVQIQTRSGTNQFHGGLVWDVQNSTLDANSWANNRTQDPLTGRAVTADWRNIHQATANFGGPIQKNKTFFFGLFDEKFSLTRGPINPVVLTPCAARGIFRYFDNVNNGNWLQPPIGGATPTLPVVSATGVPVSGLGPMRFQSVFGPLANIPTKPDCSDAVVQGSSWDPNRKAYDPTGYVQNVLLKYMPPVNNYDVGDGLNTAGSRWVRRLHGSNNLFAVGEPTQRKQYNAKIDHLFTSKHKISGTWSLEKSWADNTYQNWPNTWGGRLKTQPQVLALNFTSTVSSTLVNEARFGVSRSGTNDFGALYVLPDNQPLLDLLPKTSGGVLWAPVLGPAPNPFVPDPNAINFQANNVIGSRGFIPNVTQLDNSPRWTYSDSLSLTRGKHTFKVGGEFRTGSSKSTQSGQFFPNTEAIPFAYGGETLLAPVTGISSATWPGLAGSAFSGNQKTAQDILVSLSGSLNRIQQYRFINSPNQAQKAWNDPKTDPLKIRDIHQREFGAFFKDDWKATSRLTLNLGVRWDYYGPPWEKNGLTATLKGGEAGLFGLSGTNFNSWFVPGATGGSQSDLIFIGPNSPNPGIKSYKRDLNNFGPAIGFALNMDKKTTMRGGYQIQYIGGSDLTTVEGIIGNPPGSTFPASAGQFGGYLDLTSVTNNTFPVAPPVLPVLPIPITDRTQFITAYDTNYVSPYIQNMTLSITRDVLSKLTVDARYIGTLTRKNFNTTNLNVSNFLTNGLKEAFDSARAGGESVLLNQMFNGIDLGQGRVVPGFTGAAALRAAASGNMRNNLANGNYQAIADTLFTLTYSPALNPNLPAATSGFAGSVLRVNNFPENFIRVNPQFSQASLRSNGAHSNYHSLQLQTTLRPTAGFNVTGSYTWSKDLGQGTVEGFTDPRFQSADYTRISTDRRHVFNTYGSFNLPIGPGQLIAGGSSGVLARVIEGWQASWIVNLSSGAPGTITAANMLYARGTPDQVRPFDFNAAKGVAWTEGAVAGNYFNNKLTKVRDPQCSAIEASLQPLCTLNAIADTSGNIILQNAKPGTRGNVGLNTLDFGGSWTFDSAMSKTFRLNERFRGTVRVDAHNILNHPTPGVLGGFAAPPIDGGAQIDLNDFNPFGNIPTKGASTPQQPSARVFQLKVRLDF